MSDPNGGLGAGDYLINVKVAEEGF